MTSDLKNLKNIDFSFLENVVQEKTKRHPKCKGYSDYFGDFDCLYETTLTCDDCKYGVGKKDPEAKCNQM